MQPIVRYWSEHGLTVQTTQTKIIGLVDARVELVDVDKLVWMIENTTPLKTAARILAAQAKDLGCSEGAAKALASLGYNAKPSKRYCKPVKSVKRKIVKVQRTVKRNPAQAVLKF